MPRDRSRRMRWSKLNWVLGAAALYACSFQNFDYLQDDGISGRSGSNGSSGSSGKNSASGGAGASSAASGGTQTVAGTGGHAGGARGGTGGSLASSGAGGSLDAGEAGAGGSAGTGDNGGAGNGGAGESSGGKATGGKSATTGGNATTGGSATTGGKAGTGGSVGSGGSPGTPTLVNPSFESGLTGWTVTPAEAGPTGKRYVYTQAPTDSSKPPNGSQELATWHDKDSYELSVSQTLHNVPDGTYEFQGYFSSDRSGGTYMFARNCGGPDREQQVPTNSWTWFTHSIDVQVSGGSCELGIRVVGAPNDYLNADMFTFERTSTGGEGGAGGGGAGGDGGTGGI